MEAVCRICMHSSAPLVNIFEERPSRAGEPSLAEMLHECTGCQVKQEDDPLPKEICDACVLNCSIAFRFKRTCEKSQKRLMELLSEKMKQSTELEKELSMEQLGEKKKQSTELEKELSMEQNKTEESIELELTNENKKESTEQELLSGKMKESNEKELLSEKTKESSKKEQLNEKKKLSPEQGKGRILEVLCEKKKEVPEQGKERILGLLCEKKKESTEILEKKKPGFLRLSERKKEILEQRKKRFIRLSGEKRKEDCEPKRERFLGLLTEKKKESNDAGKERFLGLLNDEKKQICEPTKGSFLGILNEEEKDMPLTKKSIQDIKKEEDVDEDNKEKDDILMVQIKKEKCVMEEDDTEMEQEDTETETNIDLGRVKIEDSVFVSCGEEILPDDNVQAQDEKAIGEKILPNSKLLELVARDNIQKQKYKILFNKTPATGIVKLNKEMTLCTSRKGRVINIDNAPSLTGKIYRCKICGKEYLQLDKLARHMHIHDDYTPLKCFFCSKTFSSHSILNAHLKTHTINQSPHKCPYCPKVFLRPQLAKEHIFLHLGQYPYECDRCKKQYKSMAGFRGHVCPLDMKDHE